MNLTLQKKVINQLILNSLALIAGYYFWYSISQSQKIIVTVPVAINAYNLGEYEHIHKPTEALVTLKGKRRDFIHPRALYDLTIAIDRKNITKLNGSVETARYLFVPSGLKLINCSPTTIPLIISPTQDPV
jgi:hypothetical protein